MILLCPRYSAYLDKIHFFLLLFDRRVMVDQLVQSPPINIFSLFVLHLLTISFTPFFFSQGQIEYVQLLATYGKPIVLVQIQGRPRLMHVAVASADAVINAYQPGTISSRVLCLLVEM